MNRDMTYPFNLTNIIEHLHTRWYGRAETKKDEWTGIQSAYNWKVGDETWADFYNSVRSIMKE